MNDKALEAAINEYQTATREDRVSRGLERPGIPPLDYVNPVGMHAAINAFLANSGGDYGRDAEEWSRARDEVRRGDAGPDTYAAIGDKLAEAIGVLEAGLENTKSALKLGDELMQVAAKDLEETLERAETAEARAKELEGLLEQFRNIAFEPCKDVRCYRPTLQLMKAANAMLGGNSDHARKALEQT